MQKVLKGCRIKDGIRDGPTTVDDKLAGLLGTSRTAGLARSLKEDEEEDGPETLPWE